MTGRLLLNRHAWVRRAAGRLLGAAFADGKIGASAIMPGSSCSDPLTHHFISFGGIGHKNTLHPIDLTAVGNLRCRLWNRQCKPEAEQLQPNYSCHRCQPLSVFKISFLWVSPVSFSYLWPCMVITVLLTHHAGEPMLASDAGLAGRLALDSFRQLAAVGCDEGTARQVMPRALCAKTWPQPQGVKCTSVQDAGAASGFESGMLSATCVSERHLCLDDTGTPMHGPHAI